MKKKVILGIFFLTFSTNGVNGKGRVSIQMHQRLNTPADQGVSDQFIEVDSKEKRDFSRWDGVYSFSARMHGNDRGGVFSLPEAYLSKLNGRTTYAIGRKILNWNPNEKFWGAGDLNAVRGFSHLEDVQEGIMGFHFEKEYPKGRLAFFASALHIPQVNPTFRSKDGKVEGKNEWATAPPGFVRYQNKDIPVFYQIIYPSTDKILLHQSIGVRGEVDSNIGSFALYGMYKPENAIRLNATGFYEQDDEERAFVWAKPFVNQHVVVGGGWSHRWGNEKEWQGASYVDSVRPLSKGDESFEFASFKIQPTYINETYSTSSLSYHNSIYNIQMSYIHFLEGDVSNTNVFGKKPKWKRAVGIGLDVSPLDQIKLKANHKYDLKLKDSTTSLEGEYFFNKHFHLALGLQVLNAPSNRSFWAPYRSNDTIYSKLSLRF
jgi:hypothetical protein